MDDLKVTMGYDDGDHDEVSRTVSDTLAAEYRDYVTLKRTTPTSVEIFNPPLCSTLSSSSTSSSVKEEVLSLSDDPIVDDSNYNARVEFGLKLGYTESQVQMALVKVGPFAAQNELLEELIKLGATGTPTANLTRTNSNPTYPSNTSSICANHEAHPHHHQHHYQHPHHSSHHLHNLHHSEDSSSPSSCASTSLIDNSHRPCDTSDFSDNLRPIVIDGSNVAMSHGNKEVFSCRGLRICVDWFKARGHKEITVFVPMWRKESSQIDNPIKDREILFQLQNEKVLVFTPSRMVGGRRLTCHDDLYILNLASQNEGIVVSNDNYRDLIGKNPEYKKVVEERLLMYTFVNDRFMPPDDPLGRHGPTLEVFLKRYQYPSSYPTPQTCPYGKKCTYGNKCKYYHPERGNQPQKSVTERLLEQFNANVMEVKARNQQMLQQQASIEGNLQVVEKMRATHTGSLPPNITLCEGNSLSAKLGKKMPIIRAKPLLTAHSTSFPLDARLTSSSTLQSAQQLLFTNPIQISDTNKDSNNNNKPLTKETDSGANLHRKLQRQLTLNPTNDARLARMYGGEKNSNSNPNSNPSASSVKTCRTPEKKVVSGTQSTGITSSGHKQLMRIRSDSGYSCPSVHSGSVGTIGSGSPSNVHKKGNIQGSNAQGFPYQNVASFSSHHSNVTRIASAPDSSSITSSSWLPSRSTPLVNANSDSRLNMCQNILIGTGLNNSSQQLHQPKPQPAQSSSHLSSSSSATPPFPGSSIWSPNESQNYSFITTNWSNSPINLRPLSVPQFLPLSTKKSCPLLNNNSNNNLGNNRLTQGTQKTPMHRSLSPELFSDNPRSKLYFHLASIFPERQVRTVMDMLPGETNAQIICAALLNLAAAESPNTSQ